MTTDTETLRYDQWIENALRSVIKRALKHAVDNGLPGEHHFYITFRSQDTGVEIPPYLKAQHEDEMTIVLQYQYEDLIVEDDFFSVSLRFNGKHEKLRVPFASVTSFADPSVDFGLQLKIPTDDEFYDDEDDLGVDFADEGSENNSNSSGDTDRFGSSKQSKDKNDAGDGEKKTGEVIALDAFRKK